MKKNVRGIIAVLFCMSFLSGCVKSQPKEAPKVVPTREMTVEEHTYNEKTFVDAFPTFSVTEGLSYHLNEDGESYMVDNSEGTMELNDTNRIVFPETYNNLPVTKIGYLGFTERWWIFEIYVPKSITGIENVAFANCGLTKIYWNAFECEDFPDRNSIFAPGDDHLNGRGTP